MADLVIGHTTHNAAKIWVRGDARHRAARLALTGGSPGVDPIELTLSAADDFTGVAHFRGLDAATSYGVKASFGPVRRWLRRDSDVVEREGQLRTFPDEESDASFSFLHGSCNLSNVRLNHTAGLAAAAFGCLAAINSTGPQKSTRGWRDRIRGYAEIALKYLLTRGFRGLYCVNRLEQAKRGWLIPSPFGGLRKLVADEAGNPPSFMIHAGDQIYFDVPFPKRKPDVHEYRRTYRQAWFEDPELRELLAGCPHYMMLDDHDIVDAFACDGPVPGNGERKPDDYLKPALDAYRAYVHSRQPAEKDDSAFFYRFNCGSTPFFVLDTRTKRSIGTEQMIDQKPPENDQEPREIDKQYQMEEFESWLLEHKKQLKFVVSSVAFLAELREAKDQDDKWCGRPFRAQRERILQFVFRNGIERLVFLVGDMHCTYHATMRVGWTGRGVTLHELAGGPAYQLQFASRRDFYDQCQGEIQSGGRRIPYTTSLRRVHGAASSVLHIEARPSDESCPVRWTVVRTAGKLPPVEDQALVPPAERRGRPPPLSGRIGF